jgi:hypothetical protein
MCTDEDAKPFLLQTFQESSGFTRGTTLPFERPLRQHSKDAAFQPSKSEKPKVFHAKISTLFKFYEVIYNLSSQL